MELLMQYLTEMLGEDIVLVPLEQGDLPAGFCYARGLVLGVDCLFLQPLENRPSFSLLRQCMAAAGEKTGARPVLWLAAADSRERGQLLQARIPFIIAGCQLYLPFVFLSLAGAAPQAAAFTPATQCTFLWLFYQPRLYTSAAAVGRALGLSTMTVTRAFRVLEEAGLIQAFGYRTHKQYRRIEKVAYWQGGATNLSNPVQWTTRVAALPQALPAFRMAEGWAVSRATAAALPEAAESGVLIYIWRYDPALFADGAQADPASCFAATGEPLAEEVFIEPPLAAADAEASFEANSEANFIEGKQGAAEKEAEKREEEKPQALFEEMESSPRTSLSQLLSRVSSRLERLNIVLDQNKDTARDREK